MAKKSASIGAILAGAATVAAGAGTGYALSSHTAAGIYGILSETYAKRYKTGLGVGAVVMRALPGTLAAGAVGLAFKGKYPTGAAMAAALILGGSIVGSLAPVVEEKAGRVIASKLLEWKLSKSEDKTVGDGATAGTGGPRYASAQAAAGMNALMLPSRTVSDFGVGGSLYGSSSAAQNLSVGGPTAGGGGIRSMSI